MSRRLTWVQGPLVGKKRLSLEITEEYAKADPIYVAKTSVGLHLNLLRLLAHVLCRHYLSFTPITAL